MRANILLPAVSKCTANYLKTWFLIDFVSIFPFSDAVEAFGSSGDAAVQFEVMRLLRLLRLIKLLRVVKSLRIIAKYQARLGLRFSSTTVATGVIGLLTAAHWCGCVWHMTPGFSTAESSNWITSYGLETASMGERYFQSLYFSIMTLTTIGYGDIGPQNMIEVGADIEIGSHSNKCAVQHSIL